MQNNKYDQISMWGHDHIIRDDILRWLLAGIVVLAVYSAGAAGLYHYRTEPERLAGSPPAIMLEFAAELTAPDVQAFSETIQSYMQVDEPKPETREPEQQEAVLPEPEILKSDFVEKQQQDRTKKPSKEKSDKKRKEKRREKHKNHVAKGKQNQKAAAPDIAAKNGKTFAGRDNSRSEGFNGTSDKAWADRVYRRIQSVGRRMQRQLPGARGVVYISFVFDASGRISTVSVSRSSGDVKIDQLALRIVEHSSPLPPPPDAGKKTVPVRVN